MIFVRGNDGVQLTTGMTHKGVAWIVTPKPGSSIDIPCLLKFALLGDEIGLNKLKAEFLRDMTELNAKESEENRFRQVWAEGAVLG